MIPDLSPVQVCVPAVVLLEVSGDLHKLAHVLEEAGRTHTAAMLRAQARKLGRYAQDTAFLDALEADRAGLQG